MRHKVLSLALAVVFVASSVLGVRLLTPVGRRVLTEVAADASGYQNGLRLVIGEAYTLEFAGDYRKATVRVGEELLKNEAYVRIFDAAGNLVVGEYTEMRDAAVTVPDETPEADGADTDGVGAEDVVDGMSTEDVADGAGSEDNAGTNEDEVVLPEAEPTVPATQPSAPVVQPTVQYAFLAAPKNYEVALEPGYMIEVHAADAAMYSTLTGGVASEFAPNATERYVVTEKGLRKATWDEVEGEAAMYGLLRDYLVGVITGYQNRVTDEVLNNKNLDLVAKNQVILAYHELKPEDQTAYTEFVTHLQRGGSPVIAYLGETSYELGAELDFTTLVKITDNEDGEIHGFTCVYNVDSLRAGEYSVTYTAVDSDGNESSLTVPITIVGPVVDEPLPEAPTDTPNEPVTEPLPEPSNSVVDRITWGIIGEINHANTEPEEPAAEEEEPPASVVANRNENTTSVSKPSVAPIKPEEEAAGFSLKYVVLIGLGILALAGLVRFIFDHYVR